MLFPCSKQVRISFSIVKIFPKQNCHCFSISSRVELVLILSLLPSRFPFYVPYFLDFLPSQNELDDNHFFSVYLFLISLFFFLSFSFPPYFPPSFTCIPLHFLFDIFLSSYQSGMNLMTSFSLSVSSPFSSLLPALSFCLPLISQILLRDNKIN